MPTSTAICRTKPRRIQRFYPNRFSKSALVKAAEPLEIPGKMRFELVANSLKATETVACFASERDLVAGELPASAVGGNFAKLPAASLEEVRQTLAPEPQPAPVRQLAFRSLSSTCEEGCIFFERIGRSVQLKVRAAPCAQAQAPKPPYS